MLSERISIQDLVTRHANVIIDTRNNNPSEYPMLYVETKKFAKYVAMFKNDMP